MIVVRRVCVHRQSSFLQCTASTTRMTGVFINVVWWIPHEYLSRNVQSTALFMHSPIVQNIIVIRGPNRVKSMWDSCKLVIFSNLGWVVGSIKLPHSYKDVFLKASRVNIKILTQRPTTWRRSVHEQSWWMVDLYNWSNRYWLIDLLLSLKLVQQIDKFYCYASRNSTWSGAPLGRSQPPQTRSLSNFWCDEGEEWKRSEERKRRRYMERRNALQKESRGV